MDFRQITKSGREALTDWFCSSDIATNRRLQERLNKAQTMYIVKPSVFEVPIRHFEINTTVITVGEVISAYGP
jgi:hypothetical protein